MLCVIRTSNDEVWMWAWWFIREAHKVALVRFAEYRVSQYNPNGIVQYIETRNCFEQDNTLDMTNIVFPEDVLAEATMELTGTVSYAKR